MSETYLLGVGSISGAGKDTFVYPLAYLLRSTGLNVGILSTDDAYKNLSDRPKEKRKLLKFRRDLNFDHPDMIDFDKLIGFLQRIKRGEGFQYHKYDFPNHTYFPMLNDNANETGTLEENLDVCIVQGIYALYSGGAIGSRLISIYDKKYFINTLPEIALLRRVPRDINERGRELWDSIAQLILTVIPMYYQYVLPTRQNADQTFEWDTTEKIDPNEQKRALAQIVREKAFTILSEISEKTKKSRTVPLLDPSLIKIPELLPSDIIERLRKIEIPS